MDVSLLVTLYVGTNLDCFICRTSYDSTQIVNNICHFTLVARIISLHEQQIEI